MLHLDQVFVLMRQHKMYIKATKCSFAQPKVEYLGHFISGQGVQTDFRKVEEVAKWPAPRSLKDLRSFLGLTGYRKFIPGYAVLCRPLHDLLKKGGCQWNERAETAFVQLKEALVSATVLAVPDFIETFIVEPDASNDGIEAVLM